METHDLWRPDDYDFIVNPFPFYDKLRAKGPFFVSKTGDYVILSHKYVRQLLADKSMKVGFRTIWMDKVVDYAKKKGQDFSAVQNVMKGMLFQLNPTMHTEIRNLLARKWPDKAWIMKKSKLYAHRIVSDLPEEFDMVDQVSRKFPLMVINEIVGSNFTMDQLSKDAIMLIRVLDPYLTLKDIEQINEAAIRFYEHFYQFYQTLEDDHPGISGAVKSNEGLLLKLGIDPVSVVIFLHLAGQDSTTYLISSVLDILLNDKVWIDRLDTDEKLEKFIQEVLRMNAPIQLTERINPTPIELDGQTIPANTLLSLCIGAANRDPECFDHPNKIDLNRNNNPHLSFGFGIHHCMGNQVALMEVFELLKVLLPKLKNIELIEKTRWDQRLSIRNINSMKVRRNA